MICFATAYGGLCAKAIEEFKDTSPSRDWLQENRLLFVSIFY